MRHYYLGICLLLCLLLGERVAYSQNLQFEQLGIEQGLSQNTIESIFQDQAGYLWVGTQDGFNRYNGYEFAVMSQHTAACVYESNDGFLWIGNRPWMSSKTIDGLATFDCKTEQFKTYPVPLVGKIMPSKTKLGFWMGTSEGLWFCNLADTTFKPVPGTEHLEIDQLQYLPNATDRILIGTTRKGLWVYDFSTEKATHIQSFSQNPAQNNVKAIKVDASGKVYVATSAGMFSWEYGRLEAVPIEEIKGLPINDFLIDSKGNWWIGTEQGLYFRPYSGKVRHFSQDSEGNQRLTNNRVTELFEDRSGVVWIGTYFGGLNKYNPNKIKFETLRHEEGKPNSLADNVVRALYQDADSSFWLGTTKGISRYDRKRGVFRNFYARPNNPDSLQGANVRLIYRDSRGRLWVCTDKGLHLYNAQRQSFKCYRHDAQDKSSLAYDYVMRVAEAKDGKLWVGTFGGGLDLFDPETGQFEHYYSERQGASRVTGRRVHSLYTDSKGTTWVNDASGFSKIAPNPAGGYSIEAYTPAPEKEGGLLSGFVKCFFEDSKGRFWIGTSTHGFAQMDREMGTFKFYGMKDGLPNNMVYGIVEDRRGHLWMSTNKGISEYDVERGIFTNYDYHDGLQSNEFNTNAYGYAPLTQEVMFGGVKGANIFNPEQLHRSSFQPPIVFTDFQVFYQSIKPAGGGALLSRNINYTSHIDLSYNHKTVSFEFASLHFANPANNSYRYKLDGFDADWVDAGTRRYITYTSLPAGTYTLWVNGTNSDGLWSSRPRSIELRVHPPFWDSLAFKALLAVLLAAIAFAVHRIRLVAIQRKNAMLDQLVRIRTEEVLQKNERLKQQHEEIQMQASNLAEANMLISGHQQTLEQSNREIQDSLNYASRVQKSIFSMEGQIKADFGEKNCFIFYRPRATVSGDFYWHYHNAGKSIVVVADCMGHGVPGAFMSLICHNLLTQLVYANLQFNPAHVLKEMHRAIQDTLPQDVASNQDGMDMGIVAIDWAQQRMAFAGAQHPLIYFQNGEMHHIKGDRHSIGGSYIGLELTFTNHEISIAAPTTFYLFSDGYIDQLGGENHRKFMAKNFKAFLQDIHSLSMDDQEERMLHTLEAWMNGGNEKQTDDVLVAGFRVGVPKESER